MLNNSYVFSRTRKYYGRQPLFSDLNQLQFDQPPNHTLLERNFILRNPVNESTSLRRDFAFSECLTDNVDTKDQGMNHAEGGWPREVNKDDEEATLRQRKKIEREDEWVPQLLKVTALCKTAIAQNTALDIYEDYFATMEPPDITLPLGTTKSFNFRDFSEKLTSPNRPVVQVAWGPGDSSSKILAIHSSYQFTIPDKYCHDIYIWDIENSIKPSTILSAPSVITKANYCPRDDTLIAGGLKNGVAAIWDSRLDGYPVNSCPIEASHLGPISAFTWVQSKTNTEFYTGATDGLICYWDGRHLKKPYYKVYIDPVRTDKQEPLRAHTVSVLEFEHTIPVRFMAGSNMGVLFLGNRKGSNPLETFTGNFRAMDGPIKSLQRNPTFVKNIMVAGAWSVKIWCEECKENPIMKIPPQDSLVNVASWSPTRISMFCTGHEDCTIRFWDFLLSHKDPIYIMTEFGSPVISLSFKDDGKELLVGTKVNGIFLVHLDELLSRSFYRDKPIMAAMMERELRRVKILEGRVKEIKLARFKAKKSLTLNPRDLRYKVDALEYDTPSEVTQEETFKDEEEEDFGKEEAELVLEEEHYVDPDPQLTELTRTYLAAIDQVHQANAEKVFVLEPTIYDDEIT